MRIVNKSLKTNAVLNGIKQCCAILFPLITFPYISRILGSEGFGKYSFSYSISNYFILLAALGISSYAIREGAKIRDNKEKITKFASQMFSLNICAVIFSYILLIVAFFVSSKIQSYAQYIFAHSLIMVLAAIGTDWVNSIYEDFYYITLKYIFVHIISLVMMFSFVKTSDDVVVYCIISVIASSGGNLLNIFYIRKYLKIKFTFDMEVKKHLLPLLVLFVNSLAITIYVESDITMLGIYYDDSIVGTYGFVSKIYNILKQLVYAIVAVVIPRVAYVVGNQKNMYKHYMNKILWALTAVLLPIITGLFGMSTTIIRITGGEEYVSGSYSLKVLGFALIFAVLAAMFSYCVLIVFNEEKKCLNATVAAASINVLLNFIVLPKFGIIGAAITTLIAEMTTCFVQMHYSRKYFDCTKVNFKPLIPCLAGSGLIYLICIFSNNFIENIYVRMYITLAISCVCYGAVLLLLRHPLAIDALNQLKRRIH